MVKGKIHIEAARMLAKKQLGNPAADQNNRLAVSPKKSSDLKKHCPGCSDPVVPLAISRA